MSSKKSKSKAPAASEWRFVEDQEFLANVAGGATDGQKNQSQSFIGRAFILLSILIVAVYVIDLEEMSIFGDRILDQAKPTKPYWQSTEEIAERFTADGQAFTEHQHLAETQRVHPEELEASADGKSPQSAPSADGGDPPAGQQGDTDLGKSVIGSQPAPITEEEGSTSEEGSESTAPSTEESAPSEEESAPIEEESAPIEEKSAPSDEEPAAIEEESAPVEGETAPIEEEYAPSDVDSRPVRRDLSPLCPVRRPAM